VEIRAKLEEITSQLAVLCRSSVWGYTVKYVQQFFSQYGLDWQRDHTLSQLIDTSKWRHSFLVGWKEDCGNCSFPTRKHL